MPDERSDERRLAMTAAQSERRLGSGAPDAPLISDWLHIRTDDVVEVYTGKVEVGQNARTALAQAVAEELCVPVDAIQLIVADTDRTPFDAGTFGSQTTPTMSRRLRMVAASARELLIACVAARWQVEPSRLMATNGVVHDRQSGQTITYGALTGGEPLAVAYRQDQPLTPPQAWTIAGTSAPKVEGRAIVTGQRRYTPDLSQPGMLVGKVLRPPPLARRSGPLMCLLLRHCPMCRSCRMARSWALSLPIGLAQQRPVTHSSRAGT